MIDKIETKKINQKDNYIKLKKLGRGAFGDVSLV